MRKRTIATLTLACLALALSVAQPRAAIVLGVAALVALAAHALIYREEHMTWTLLVRHDGRCQVLYQGHALVTGVSEAMARAYIAERVKAGQHVLIERHTAPAVERWTAEEFLSERGDER